MPLEIPTTPHAPAAVADEVLHLPWMYAAAAAAMGTAVAEDIRVWILVPGAGTSGAAAKLHTLSLEVLRGTLEGLSARDQGELGGRLTTEREIVAFFAPRTGERRTFRFGQPVRGEALVFLGDTVHPLGEE